MAATAAPLFITLPYPQGKACVSLQHTMPDYVETGHRGVPC
ncbi:hypothetical protein AcetOrient_orf03684 [Acetobacter orientalis]|uniref:Uncharacterized protein n=1 Tax=Acetobacter orientalis TaxID=146474 RepID=A0A2Z5ZJX1_9PROT|nr:hypothetical protein AcetOrient_orf03684 [Acetobacter orientalis]